MIAMVPLFYALGIITTMSTLVLKVSNQKSKYPIAIIGWGLITLGGFLQGNIFVLGGCLLWGLLVAFRYIINL